MKIVVPQTPGGATDALARIIAEKLSAKWQQPVICENRGGASGTVGSGVVARSAPDGHTLLIQAISHVINKSLMANITYDPIDDFTPITSVGYQPVILSVHPSIKANTLAEFIELAKAKPDEISCGVANLGAIGHLAGILLEQRANIKLLTVPFGGSSQTVTALLGGHLNASFLNTTVAVPAFKEKTVRGLATSGRTRWRELPDIPTIAEQGFPDFEAVAWYAFIGPARMPPELVQQIYTDIRSVMQIGEVRERIMNAGFELMDQTPKECSDMMVSDMKKWGDIIRAAGIQPQ